MTTAQYNQPRRWSCLQCVRDEESTKDHENSARHATNKLKSTTILHASYAGSDAAWWRRCAAHDDDKVRIATNKQENTKSQTNAIKAPSLTAISKPKQQHEKTSKNNHRNKHPSPSNNLTVEIQYFQMRKMHQR
jgi:hypothetical protein